MTQRRVGSSRLILNLVLRTIFILSQVDLSIGIDIALSDVCGVKLLDTCPNKISLKVIGGRSTCAEKVPWNVLVELKTNVLKPADGGIPPYCGGVLISEKHVLSAAHCFHSNTNQFGVCPPEYGSYDWQRCKRSTCPDSCVRVSPNDLNLHLGLTSRLQIDSRNVFKVMDIAIHPGWDKTQKLNDILAGHDLAVLTMSKSLNMLDKRTVPICLPNPARDIHLYDEDETGDVTGFGIVINPRNGNKKFPAEVQTARVTITSKQQCKDLWNIRGNQVCAAGNKVISNSGDLQLVADSCNGDSGGGLTTSDVDGREVLIGIISFGEPDCGRLRGKPGVYTNVLDHLDWVQGIVGRTSNLDITSPNRCTANNGKACKFPFRFRGKLYPGCTTDFDNDNKAWCSTKTDANGNHIIGEKEWGHCPPGCPVDIDKAPTNSGGSSNNGGNQWSEWSSCSVTCGTGKKVRTNKLCPRNAVGCTTTQSSTCRLGTCNQQTSSSNGNTGSSSGDWSAWSACSKSCGGGVQRRSLIGRSTVVQTRGCNNQACIQGTTGGTGGTFSTGGTSSTNGRDDDDDYDDKDSYQESSMWIVGGSGGGDSSVESVYVNSNARLCSQETTPLPEERDAAIGAYIEGRVYVCGGGSGTFEDPKTHNTCFMTSALTPGVGWQEIASMPVNTSNAAFSVYGRKLYVIGGYTKPVCGYKPQVQVFDHDSQRWSSRGEWDPTLPPGAYGCAVTSRDKIYLTGGWYSPDTYTSNCKEKLSDEELSSVNRQQDLYLSRVQVLDPNTMRWQQGPSMKIPRRNHGCAEVAYHGFKGIIVAGGYNSQDNFLRSVEFLTSDGQPPRWIRLPDLLEPRGSIMGLIHVGNLFYVLGGDLTEKRTVEVFSEDRGRWDSVNKRLLRERSYATFIPNVITSRRNSIC